MTDQDKIRKWIKGNLDVMGRGARRELADFLGLNPLQITRMLNTKPGKEMRSIKADEWIKIKIFFGKNSECLSLETEEFSDRERLFQLYTCVSPDLQQALLTILEALHLGEKKK